MSTLPPRPHARLRTVVLTALALCIVVVALGLREAGDWLRRRLEAELQARLVPQVRIAEPVQIVLWPSPRIHIRGLSLVEAPDREVLAIESLTLNPSLAALGRGRLALDSAKLSGAVLTLRHGPDGWNTSAWLRERADSGEEGVPLPRIDRVTVEDAAIRLEGPYAAELSGLNMTAGPFAPGAAGTVEAGGRLHVAATHDADLEFTFTTDFRLEKDALATGSAHLTASGNVGDYQLRKASLRLGTLDWGASSPLTVSEASLSLDGASGAKTLTVQAGLAGLSGRAPDWRASAFTVAVNAGDGRRSVAAQVVAPLVEAAAGRWQLPEMRVSANVDDPGRRILLAATASAAGSVGDKALTLDVTRARTELPHPADPARSLPVQFTGVAKVDAGQRAVNGTLSGSFDASRFEGTWRYDPAEVPPTQAQVVLDRLVLDRYLPAQDDAGAPADLGAWRDWPVSAELQVGTLTFRNTVSERARLRLSGGAAIRNGR